MEQQCSSTFDLESYVKFFEQLYGYTEGFMGLLLPPIPKYPVWPLVIVPAIPVAEDVRVSMEKFESVRNPLPLEDIRDIVKRPDRPYVAWVRACAHADLQLMGRSAEDVAKMGIDFLTFKERLVLGLQRLYLSQEDLDGDGSTLCAGSRWSTAVPYVYRVPGRQALRIGYCGPAEQLDSVRARQAVVPK